MDAKRPAAGLQTAVGNEILSALLAVLVASAPATPGKETRLTNHEQAREMASAQAKLIMQQDALILDTETTGLQGDAEICEIAVMDSHG